MISIRVLVTIHYVSFSSPLPSLAFFAIKRQLHKVRRQLRSFYLRQWNRHVNPNLENRMNWHVFPFEHLYASLSFIMWRIVVYCRKILSLGDDFMHFWQLILMTSHKRFLLAVERKVQITIIVRNRNSVTLRTYYYYSSCTMRGTLLFTTSWVARCCVC